MPLALESEPRAADTGGVGLSAKAFTDIYAQHMPELTRYCRGILRDRDDAEDAAQSAMERALRALAAGREPDRMRPWLLTIARNEAIDLLRRRRPQRELDETAPAPHGSPEELAAVRQRLADLLIDLRALAPRQREVLIARELGGRSYRQIARDLGTSESAAQQVVLEARRSLRQFELGRSLECGDVQAWLSAHDHARVRTRRVRAHLRACDGCRGFQVGIRGRRRDLALLLPGIGGGAGWWSPLIGLLGPGGAKAVTAAAVLVTGAALVATGPFDSRSEPPATANVRAPATATPGPALPPLLTARLHGAHPREGAPRDAGRRRRGRSRSQRAARRPGALPPPAAGGAAGSAGGAAAAHETVGAPAATRPASGAAPSPATTPPPSSGSGPVPGPAELPSVGEVLSAADPVLERVPEVNETLAGVVEAIREAVAPVPEVGLAP